MMVGNTLRYRIDTQNTLMQLFLPKAIAEGGILQIFITIIIPIICEYPDYYSILHSIMSIWISLATLSENGTLSHSN
jgi:hypothetical protein